MKKIAKTVIINRAVPGSGKSSISNTIEETLAAENVNIAVHSTDNFFMRGNRYCFDITKLSKYHWMNLAAFTEDLRAGTDVVICDNTNLQPWQTLPYTKAARKYNYQILFLNFLPRELWKHVQSQIVTEEKPDAHEVSEELLKEFIVQFNDYNDLLDPDMPLDANRHFDYIWDEKALKAVKSGRKVSRFDCDKVLTIHPEEYQAAKKEMGKKVLEFVRN